MLFFPLWAAAEIVALSSFPFHKAEHCATIISRLSTTSIFAINLNLQATISMLRRWIH
jgi:hypothetical protein